MENPIEKAYQDDGAFYKDQLLLLDYVICVFLAERGEKNQEDPLFAGLKGLVVTDAEAVRLLGGSWNSSGGSRNQTVEHLLYKVDEASAVIDRRRKRSRQEGILLALPYLSEVFGLNLFEEQCLFLCFAPELDRKYEKLFAYLQDDVNVRYPTVDLVQKLLCREEDERLISREYFSPGGKLSQFFLKHDPEAETTSLLARRLRLKDRVIRFLLYHEDLDAELSECAKIVEPEDLPPPIISGKELNGRMVQYAESHYGNAGECPGKSIVFHLWGRPGAGKKLQVWHFCHRFTQKLLVVDLKRLVPNDAPLQDVLKPILFEAVLHRAAVCFSHLECLIGDEKDDQKILTLLDGFRSFKGILFLLSEVQWKPREKFPGFVTVSIPLKLPLEQERKILWEHFAAEQGVSGWADWTVVSNQFRFTPGQIENAVVMAKNTIGLDGDSPEALTCENLCRACYAQVHHRLEEKASLIRANYGWDDLILPEGQKQQLRNACSQVKYRNVVYGEWGFHKKLSYGKGLSILFSGPPGTGKTMGAQVVAKELMLEIYKVDLSQVISKYIGETEKNLREIFNEAKYSNAILFFDETDALFGKRSEVKDSHDKYANIEVAFLLQKMEEYDGITILATNYIQNIDEAFLRRIQFIIHFPFPDAEQREKLWKGIFPKETPLSDDIDYRYLARKFEVSGGNIKNIAVYAAFLAAERKHRVGMAEIITAAGFEMKKTGKVLVPDEFPEYADLFQPD